MTETEQALRNEVRIAGEYAVRLCDLVGCLAAQFKEGGSALVGLPDDDTFQYKLEDINLVVWQLRWQLGVSSGQVIPDPEPARERATNLERLAKAEAAQ